MELQQGSMHAAGLAMPWWTDGLDGQEDELEDVYKGKLDPPTDDEGPGEIDDKPRFTGNNKENKKSIEDLEREAGIRPM